MFEIIVFDIESDNLLQKLTKMHLLRIKDVATGEKKVFYGDDTSWMTYLSNAQEISGHNIVGFDLMALRKLYDFHLPDTVKVTDTLLLSQILNYQRFPNEGHSLDRWGEAMGLPKLHFEETVRAYAKLRDAGMVTTVDMQRLLKDSPALEPALHQGNWDHFMGYPIEDNNVFAKFSPFMDIYCERDVDVNVQVYKALTVELERLASKKPEIKIYVEAEHAAAEFSAEANLLGWEFNRKDGEALQKELLEKVDHIHEVLSPRLGYKCVFLDKKGGEVRQKTFQYTMKGNLNANQAKYLGDAYPRQTPTYISGNFKRIEIRPLSLDSSDDVKTFLFRHGWVPTEWNFRKREDGKKERTSPKIVPEDLELLGGDGKLYSDLLTAKSRLGVLNGWLEQLDGNDRLHGDIMVVGTPSMRARHSIIANIPGADAVYGKEIRSLFTVKEGWTLVGADSSGNQARGLAHYLGNEEYTDIILNGDIHTYNKDKLTQVLARMQIDYEVPRGAAKRVLYAFLFGASGGKLWSYIFGNHDAEKGKKLKDGFAKSVPGFMELIKTLERIYEKTKRTGLPYIPSIAGNRVYVDSKHKLLVYLLQSAEKATCSAAIMLGVRQLRKEGIQYEPKVFMHDEYNLSVPDEYAERTKEIMQWSFGEAAKLFGITIMDGEAKIGKTWLTIH